MSRDTKLIQHDNKTLQMIKTVFTSLLYISVTTFIYVGYNKTSEIIILHYIQVTSLYECKYIYISKVHYNKNCTVMPFIYINVNTFKYVGYKNNKI